MNSGTGAANIFVGRQQEMAVLEKALDDALSSRGQIVMLAGEPGIGKTRLAQELASHAESLGAQVWWGSCYEHTGAPPYWPYVQPIRAYVEQTGLQQLTSEMGPGATDIAQIVPSVAEKMPGLEPAPALAPEQARFRLFDSLATFLKNVCLTRPLVMVLDDLHWADGSSLMLLEFLAQDIGSSPILIIGTYRDDEVTGAHQLTHVLGGLVRIPYFNRLHLDGLTEGEVGEFVAAKSGVVLDTEAAATMHRRTDGNPLFVSEVVGLFNPQEMTGGSEWADTLPVAVRETIMRRLGRLSEPCKAVLKTACVIGRQFDHPLLEELTPDIDEDRFVSALDEALDARVIEAVPPGPGHYQFGHALIQEAIYEDISPVRRAREHGRVAETMERLHRLDLDDHAAALAHHFTRAGGIESTQKVARYSLIAGEHALKIYAQEEALGHFQRGLIAKGVDVEGVAPAPDAEAAALLFGLGRAQAATLRRQHLDVPVVTLRRAFDYYAEMNDVARAVTVAEYPIQSRPGNRVSMDFVARALQLLPPDAPEAGRLLSRYAFVMGMEEGDYRSATEAFDGALAIARRTGDVALEMQTLAQSSMVDYWHLEWDETVAKGLYAIELARFTSDQLSEVSARFYVGIAFLSKGEPSEALLHASAILSTAESLRDHYSLAAAFWLNEATAIVEGDWQAARDFNERGLSASPSDTRLLGTRMLTEYQTGNMIEGDLCLEQLVEALRLVTPGPKYDYGSAALLIPLVACISGADEWLNIAESAAATVLSSQFATPLVSKHARRGLALIAVLQGDAAAAKEQYGNLRSAVNSNFLISDDRILGLLAQTMGALNQAVAHFEDALAFCRKAGYRPDVAWTCSDYAETLGQRDGPQDRENAIILLNESLVISTELGMGPLMERVVGLQERAKAQPKRSPAFPDGLTQREVEVLRLVATGKTDREIAGELIISINTVGNHVKNILNKTNVANRTEAATYAALRGLTDKAD